MYYDPVCTCSCTSLYILYQMYAALMFVCIAAGEWVLVSERSQLIITA